MFSDDARVIVVEPARRRGPLPVLVALGGRPESNLFPENSVLAWPRDYRLLDAMRNLTRGYVPPSALEGNVDPARLAEVNRALVDDPFRGMIVLCVRTPDVHLRKPAAIAAFGEYVTRTVLPRARRELPILASPSATGITGWSLGGALALRIGLGNPDVFGAVSAVQAAVADDQIPGFVALGREARRRSPSLRLRALESTGGYFYPVLRELDVAWREAGVEHDALALPGLHDHAFIRGAGVHETLFWHDRNLVGA